jgi:hypothetical protein
MAGREQEDVFGDWGVVVGEACGEAPGEELGAGAGVGVAFGFPITTVPPGWGEGSVPTGGLGLVAGTST